MSLKSFSSKHQLRLIRQVCK